MNTKLLFLALLSSLTTNVFAMKEQTLLEKIESTQGFLKDGLEGERAKSTFFKGTQPHKGYIAGGIATFLGFGAATYFVWKNPSESFKTIYSQAAASIFGLFAVGCAYEGIYNRGLHHKMHVLKTDYSRLQSYLTKNKSGETNGVHNPEYANKLLEEVKKRHGL